jgi:hypothetical protein
MCLKYISCYACTEGKLETQVVSFLRHKLYGMHGISMSGGFCLGKKEHWKTESLLFPSGPHPLTTTPSHASIGMGSHWCWWVLWMAVMEVDPSMR